MPCHAMSCHVMLCRHAIPCHAMPCHAMPCHAMPCHAMPCHAIPCYAMPCHAMSCHSKATAKPERKQIGQILTKHTYIHPCHGRRGGGLLTPFSKPKLPQHESKFQKYRCLTPKIYQRIALTWDTTLRYCQVSFYLHNYLPNSQT